MAVTSIWSVKGNLNSVVLYAGDSVKTTNPEYGREQWLSNVISYAVQDKKTSAVVHDERKEVLRRFVSGVNCMPDTAWDEMMAVKKGFGKTGGVVAYHGYQSFAPGEATPEVAHEIGVKLARRLWGDRYQVLVATHLDKDTHIHSHFVVNTVSMVDGIRYHRTAKDYYDMQRESDALCIEYGLSVIQEPGRGRSKQYSEWRADNNGQQTWRGVVKSDVDAAIRQSMTERQFFMNLRSKGYEIKGGKDISVRPPGKERFVRLQRNFGDGYTIEGIRKRILAQDRPERLYIPPQPQPKQYRLIGAIHRQPRVTGLRALYYYYLYRMGVIPKRREPSPKQVYFLFREDIRFMREISKEARLLVKHGIDTDVQLASYKEGLVAQVEALTGQRKVLRNLARRAGCGHVAAVKEKTAALSAALAGLRRDIRLCEGVEQRSAGIKDKLRYSAGSGNNRYNDKEKEAMKHEQYKETRKHHR